MTKTCLYHISYNSKWIIEKEKLSINFGREVRASALIVNWIPHSLSDVHLSPGSHYPMSVYAAIVWLSLGVRGRLTYNLHLNRFLIKESKQEKIENSEWQIA